MGRPDQVTFSTKEKRIGRAMQAYLERKKAQDASLTSHIEEYDLGKRHLANIMGKDPDDFSQEDVDEAIRYLLPSGLYNRKARPMLKHPFEILPRMFAARFDATGRPNHFLFYTVKQNYYELMHNIAWKIEDLKAAEDEQSKKSVFDFDAHEEDKVNLLGSDWIPKDKLEEKLGETLSDPEYHRFIVIIQHLADQPLSEREDKFILQYRYQLRPMSEFMNIPEPKTDEEGREYMVANGSRKSAKAWVVVYGKGTGKIQINGDDITYFDELVHREQVIFPLQFTNNLGKFDVVAKVEGGGPTGQSGAIRLGISKALLSFVTKEMAEKMRLAGLLTRDPRNKERKKPGQEGARRKFTWKKR